MPRFKSITLRLAAMCFIAVSALAADYKWPATDDGGWPKDKEAWRILENRFDAASKRRLGAKADITAIKAAILNDVKHYEGKTSVHDIRWLSPTLVMAEADWTYSSQDAGGYYYVVEKKEGKWHIVTHYLIAVS